MKMVYGDNPVYRDVWERKLESEIMQGQGSNFNSHQAFLNLLDLTNLEKFLNQVAFIAIKNLLLPKSFDSQILEGALSE